MLYTMVLSHTYCSTIFHPLLILPYHAHRPDNIIAYDKERTVRHLLVTKFNQRISNYILLASVYTTCLFTHNQPTRFTLTLLVVGKGGLFH